MIVKQGLDRYGPVLDPRGAPLRVHATRAAVVMAVSEGVAS